MCPLGEDSVLRPTPNHHKLNPFKSTPSKYYQQQTLFVYIVINLFFAIMALFLFKFVLLTSDKIITLTFWQITHKPLIDYENPYSYEPYHQPHHKRPPSQMDPGIVDFCTQRLAVYLARLPAALSCGTFYDTLW